MLRSRRVRPLALATLLAHAILAASAAGGGFGGPANGQAVRPQPRPKRPHPLSPAAARVWVRLHREIDLDEGLPHETPLEDMLKLMLLKEVALEEAPGGPPARAIQIYVDPNGLQAAERTITSPVVLPLQRASLATALRLISSQLGMIYGVHPDGYVVLDSREAEDFPPEMRDPIPAEAARTWGRLAEPVTMQFPNDTPLEDVLKYLKVATTDANHKGLAFAFDVARARDDSEAVWTLPVRIELEGIPISASLKLALGQLNLTYDVDDSGVVVIRKRADEPEDSSDVLAAETAEELKYVLQLETLRADIAEQQARRRNAAVGIVGGAGGMMGGMGGGMRSVPTRVSAPR